MRSKYFETFLGMRSTNLELFCKVVKMPNPSGLLDAGLVWYFPSVTHQVWLCNAAYNQNTIDGWTKGCILLFPKKGDLGLVKNYRGITLISRVAKIYNALQHNQIEPKIEKILQKNQNGFRRNWSTISQMFPIRRVLEGVHGNNL